jgi:type IV pilus assembly protein PilC
MENNLSPENKNFATSGTESYALNSENAPVVSQKPVDRIVLNIKEAQKKGILLEGVGQKKKGGLGNMVEQVNTFLISHANIKDNVKANFLHLLSVMINAGIPMVNALRALGQQQVETPRMMIIIAALMDEVEKGKSLSEAMMAYPDVFAEKDVGMIRAGEASGQLANALENLADDTLKAYEIKAKVKSAMMYPMVVMLLLVGVFVAMMVFVIPKLKDLFNGFGEELPLVTRIVMGISDFLINQKMMLIGLIMIVAFAFIMFKRTEAGKYALDLFKLKVPLLGKLFQKAYLSRFSRSLSNLLGSGLSIVSTLEIVANSVGNEVYRKKLLIATEDLKQGIPMAEALAESEFFPPMLLSMIDIGEKTAQLDTILAKVATFYEDEVSTSVNGLSKILEPIILVVIGLSVGVVVAAVMIPIMQMSNLASAM